MKKLNIGIDVGKRHDPTAIVVAVAEDRKRPDGRWETHYTIPFLKRLPLGMEYPLQAMQLVSIGRKALKKFCEVERQSEVMAPHIFVDVTGVGDAMVDLLKKNDIKSIGKLRACRFAAGDHLRTTAAGEFAIGKAHFTSRLQILVESRRIHIPKIPEASTLAEEMLNFDIDVDEASWKATFGAIRPGTHDDLVCALGLACLRDLPGPKR